MALACIALPATAAHVCTIGVNAVNFGTVTGAQSNTSATVTVTCTLTGPLSETANFTATLSTGAGSYAQRIVTRSGSPPDTLNYNLYPSSVPATLNTNVWGDGTGSTLVWSGSITMTIATPVVSQTLTLAAALAATPSLPTAGTYSDTITATLTY